MKTSIIGKKMIILFTIISIIIFQSNLQSRVFSSKTRLLIFDFQPIGVSEDDARTITELISAKIVKHNVFTVIDRTHLESIIKEHELQKNGLTTHEERMKLGRMLNSEKLMHGSVSRMNGIYYIIIKITDIVKGTIEWSDAVKLKDLSIIDQHISIYLEKIVRDDAIDGNIFMKKTQNPVEKKNDESSGVMNDNKINDPSAIKINDNKGPYKSSWYIGSGIGGGNGTIKYADGKKTSIKKFESDRDDSKTKYYGNTTQNFGIGFIFNQNIHLGFDVSFIDSTADKYNGSRIVEDDLFITNYISCITYFPFSKGLFFRQGAGFSTFSRDIKGTDENTKIKSSGIAVLAGTGYAFSIYRSFNLCINLDYSRQYYARNVKSSDFWNLYVSFYWF